MEIGWLAWFFALLLLLLFLVVGTKVIILFSVCYTVSRWLSARLLLLENNIISIPTQLIRTPSRCAKKDWDAQTTYLSRPRATIIIVDDDNKKKSKRTKTGTTTMRLFLLPISTRRTLIFCERVPSILAPGATKPPLADRIITKSSAVWTGWEKAEKGWQKKVTEYGNALFRRIPFEEWGLKTLPPATKKRLEEVEKGKGEMG